MSDSPTQPTEITAQAQSAAQADYDALPDADKQRVKDGPGIETWLKFRAAIHRLHLNTAPKE